MSTPHLTRVGAVAATAVLATVSLSGCSLFKTTAAPISHPARHVSHRPSPPTPTPTPSPTIVASSSAPASPSASASTTTPAEHLTTYRHLVVKLPVSDSSVPGAPAGFTAYLESALDADWHKLGGTQGCEKAASIQVERISSLGFAMVARNIDPAIPTCVNAASYAGGYQAILGDKDGTWSQLVALQDEPSCSQMRQLGVPQSIYQKCD